ncbi:MCE family protein [Jatrophihabitans cynanchi]|jgi:virulence factor Mce-like protein|uniref:MCE family protein n=1 Tax=Jatrophihabitans cynanchi TaxID=2944128 RepID=A0ABY7K5I9_9ACTN|nr:MCE family protein [Jatrophihabitans sp. SB3-54]WAX58882.1 MCE family protein [Jatrophihabitans sp. SB3-54]
MIARLSANLTRVVVGVVVVAVALGVGLYVLLGGRGTRSVTAHFASAVGVYPGTPVEILGVKVGKVDNVTPQGASVAVKLEYDSKYDVPADAVAVIIANSLVSDRYVQLAPAYNGGPKLASGATIPLSRTASPAELDDIYAALDKLSTALGPNGANSDGALDTFVKVAAANLQGNGAALGQSITALSQAAKTLSDGREDLFGTVKNLQAFTQALAASDTQVRHFEEQLAQVAGDLANERADLGAALHNLGNALDSVATFVHDNAAKVHTDLSGLKDITGVLIKQKASINETLAVGPIALANLVHAYQDDLGVVGTRSNLASITDPGQICLLLNAGGLLAPVGNLLGPLTGEIAKTCQQVIAKLPGGGSLPSGVDPAALQALIQQLLDGGLGGLIPVGGG